MPHYANGIEAHVGDYVTGHCYNTPGLVAGTIVSITPGTTSCNAQVEFLCALPYFATEAEGKSEIPRMAVHDEAGNLVAPRIQKSQVHGSAGPLIAVYLCRDFCAVNELTKVGSADPSRVD